MSTRSGGPSAHPRPALRALHGCLLALLLVSPALRANAQPTAAVDPRLYAALTWRNLGPFRAGRVGAVSAPIGQPGVYYAGFPGGGLWKTTSAGQVWFPIFDAVRTTSSIGAVEVAPSNPDIVYVGTGDMITGGTLDQGTGVYKSVDAGRTWASLGLDGTRHIQTMLVDPRNPDIVLVGALGDHIHANDQRGVYRSTDGGRTWTKTLYIDDQTGIAKLARAHDVPDVIFASTVRHHTPPGYAVGKYRSWQFGTARMPGDTSATRTAIWKSLDGGATWTKLPGTGMPPLEGRVCMSVAIGTDARRVYLISNDALWRSDDGGATWRRMAADDDRIRNGQGGYSCGVYVDPKNPDLIYTINTAAYRSTDGGQTFTGMKGAPGGDDPQQLWIDPTNGQRILMGLDQGATISLDGGATWSSWYNQSTEQLYHLSADNSSPYWVYATQQDAGAIRTRVRGNHGAVTMFDWNPVNGWEWGTVIADPLDPATVYASGNGIVKISYPTEQWINVSPAIDPEAGARSTSDLPLVWAPWNRRLLLAGLNYVAGTTDGGGHWTRLSPELGIAQGMDSATAARTPGGRGAIAALSASAKSVGEIWAGTDNGLIHVTRDGGTTWRDVSIPDLPSPRRAMISSIEASPHTPGTAWAAVELLRVGDHAPYVFRTRDYGRTWTRIVAGLPADEPSGSFARVVRPDPVKPGLLFAGTESSVYVSFNDGDSWQSLTLNLPNTPVRDLLVKDNDLLIATHGRGLWVIDDISTLRQVTPALAAAPLHLFTPGVATRMHRNVNSNTPLPPDIAHADNPPDGAIIDYWLGSAATGRVTLDVLDARGTVVRRYSSDPIAPVTEAARPPHPNFWVEVPAPLPTGAGLHRVHWNLRHDAPLALTHSFEINANPGRSPAAPEGPLVLPGVYTLRLTANGATTSVPVTVRNDPRSRATPLALRAQHALTLQVVDRMRVAFTGQRQVDSVRSALARMERGAPESVTTATATVRAAIDAAVGADASAKSAGRFRDANDALGAQLIAQDNADHAPNAGMLAALAKVSRDLAATDAAWDRVLRQDLAMLNAVRAKAGLAPIAVPAR
ncbi:MAG: hypothetical protein U5K74_12695 [Gemmatimonadaceae bacterium]|nr:hypothetical protein [Gemmatimonadaceae bacterium]